MFSTLKRFRENILILTGKTSAYGAGPNDRRKRATVEVTIQVILTIGITGIAMYLLINNHSEGAQKLASGWVGVVLGYWFR